MNLFTVRTYLQQLSTDTRCSLDDLLEAMDERERETERERQREFGKSVQAAWDDDDDNIEGGLKKLRVSFIVHFNFGKYSLLRYFLNTPRVTI